MPRCWWTLVLLFAAVGAGVAAAQTQTPNGQKPQLVPRTPEQREHTFESHRRVNLHVAVTDASGKPVSGIKAEEFTVVDRGQPQKLVEFTEVKDPISGGDKVHGLVVLDAINSGRAGVARMSSEVIAMLAHGEGALPYPLQIIVVSDEGIRVGKPTTDRRALTAELTQLTRNVSSSDCNTMPPAADMPGVTFDNARWDCLNAHFRQSLNALNRLALAEQKAEGRAIVIWTGAGWPLPRQLETGQIMPGGAVNGDLSAGIVTLEADLEKGKVTLEAVSPGRFERAGGVRRTGLQGSLAGASLPEQEAALELPSLAENSGGLVLERVKDLAESVNECVANGEQYYAIAFDPAPASTQNEYRSIEVRVNRPGLTVRTLRGYFAQP